MQRSKNLKNIRFKKLTTFHCVDRKFVTGTSIAARLTDC